MRTPGEDVYLPTLYFNGPIDPANVKRQVKSIVRRIAVLLSSKPMKQPIMSGDRPSPCNSVCMSTTRTTVSVCLVFTENRPLYMRSWGGGKNTPRNHNIASDGKGYIGGHPWYDTVRGHHGVTVDNLDRLGNAGTPNQRIRSDLTEPVKFTAVAAKGSIRRCARTRHFPDSPVSLRCFC